MSIHFFWKFFSDEVYWQNINNTVRVLNKKNCIYVGRKGGYLMYLMHNLLMPLHSGKEYVEGFIKIPCIILQNLKNLTEKLFDSRKTVIVSATQTKVSLLSNLVILKGDTQNSPRTSRQSVGEVWCNYISIKDGAVFMRRRLHVFWPAFRN